MPINKHNKPLKSRIPTIKGIIEGAGETVEQPIVSTVEQNYMPYAMSVILSRAIPEIDGFKPSHRKLLYTMYKMGLLDKARTKSANIVGQTMKLNPHGDSAIYDTMVRLSRGYEALLHPYVDSKGNFGKFYSRDMAWAASRYTEAKLDEICTELFADIDKDTVDFVPNYDNTLMEPSLLPAKFPSILVNANTGIAVGMASSICPFNLREICNTTIELIKNPEHDIKSTLIAPDFPGGGNILYNEDLLDDIYKTGRGSIKVRGKFIYDKSANCIDISSIPPTTTTEAIIEKIIELSKKNQVKEISDIRDETGIDGLKITIDLKRGVAPEKLMQKLFKMTPLEDSFSCNFNVLIKGTPKVLGIKDLLHEWIAFRTECIRRRTAFSLKRKEEKLHLLNALKKILLDIDKAIDIIRNTKEEINVVPNLMSGFKIDEKQAEYVAEIKLRHLNKEYLIKRIDEVNSLKESIDDLKEILSDENKIRDIIILELNEVAQKFGKARKTMLIYQDQIPEYKEENDVPEYAVDLFFSRQGYFKKITPQSLRMNAEQKLKEGDKILYHVAANNTDELLFFTDKQQVYKSHVSEFQDTKASALGEFVAAKLGMEENETPIYMLNLKDYNVGFLLFFFENGKVAKVTLKSYKTKTNRKKLLKAYCDKFEVVRIFYAKKDSDYLLTSSQGKVLLVNSSMISLKTTRDTQGISVMSLTKGQKLIAVKEISAEDAPNYAMYKTKTLPVKGTKPLPSNVDDALQMRF
ncbi:MAG: topoisomerase IV [Clostridia bacterium]|nr:topoisomerase IV [Clostridia bacterium]